jgi:hypothetical protein
MAGAPAVPGRARLAARGPPVWTAAGGGTGPGGRAPARCPPLGRRRRAAKSQVAPGPAGLPGLRVRRAAELLREPNRGCSYPPV